MAHFDLNECRIIQDFDGRKNGPGEDATVTVRHNPTGLEETRNVHVNAPGESPAVAKRAEAIDALRDRVEAI